MVHAELSVVRYKPAAHSKAHWALHLRIIDTDKTRHLIYQANGEAGNLHLDVVEADPVKSRRFLEQIDICNIDTASDITDVERHLRRQPVRNEISSWTCQDWVMESLETLNEESLLDEYQYHEAKQRLETVYHD
ncbi:hypothetical protein FOMPIDRAFT_116431 [Fomitopsis schrenkii]|uniref:Uncharacterized protein n=1 Tax=Fomitopsis schrenkii TaxID=2126942 RepID=S8FUH4_FOMSC|nr:hypothetical protein FOMPIDRAFT_116431 [Fomitopsis schrenkii]